MIPLSFKQSLWFLHVGEEYFSKCFYCQSKVDCFNFDVEMPNGKALFKCGHCVNGKQNKNKKGRAKR